MSAAGRLLRAQMRDVDTPERAAERLRARRASLLAVADRVAMYPVLTIDNAQEAMAYQAERIAYHVAALDADAPPVGRPRAWPPAWSRLADAAGGIPQLAVRLGCSRRSLERWAHGGTLSGPGAVAVRGVARRLRVPAPV